MTDQEAFRLLAASRNDPVVAAWAAVSYEHGAPARVAVSPYDAWDAYQELFVLGVVSSVVFDATDVKQSFFSGKRPSEDEIQDALDTFHFLPLQEFPPMSKLGSPFGSKTAIVARESRTIAPGNGAGQLGSSTHLTSSPQLHQAGMAPVQEIPGPPASRPGPALGGPMQRQELDGPMAGTGPKPDLSSSELAGLRPTMYCACGHQLELTDDGGEVLADDDFPHGNIRIIDAVFVAHCPAPGCNKIWHCSVGEAMPHGTFA